MISRLSTPEARAVGSDTLGRAWLRVRADCQNTTWRFLAVANTNWERFSLPRSRTRSMVAPLRTQDRTATRSMIEGSAGQSCEG